MKPERSVRTLVVATSAVALAAAVAGCGADRAEPTKVKAAQVSVTLGTSDLDVYRSGDLKFFNRFRLEGALQLPSPTSIQDAAKKSRAVVIAEVADVRITRTIGEGTEAQPMVGVVLRTSEVLFGKPKTGEIVVEFLGTSTVTEPDAVAQMKASLPQGKAIWFLHAKGDGSKPKPGAKPVSEEEKQFYRLVHLDGGLLVQGPDGVAAPTSEEAIGEPSTEKLLKNNVKSFKKLSEIADDIRKLK